MEWLGDSPPPIPQQGHLGLERTGMQKSQNDGGKMRYQLSQGQSDSFPVPRIAAGLPTCLTLLLFSVCHWEYVFLVTL